MFCLLCHEKIPRLRAWRTKSEFCCDEHAEIYKKQTLERLLVDHEAHGDKTQRTPLPLPETRDESSAPPPEPPQEAAPGPASKGIPLPSAGSDFSAGRDEWRVDLPPPGPEARAGGSGDELFDLIGRGGPSERERLREAGPGSDFGLADWEEAGPSTQSADEALEALRKLASHGRETPPVEDEDLSAAEDFEDETEEERDEERPSAEEILQRLTAEPLGGDPAVPLPEGEEPEAEAEESSAASILDRLMEEPLATPAARLENAEGGTAGQGSGQGDAELEEPPLSMLERLAGKAGGAPPAARGEKVVMFPHRPEAAAADGEDSRDAAEPPSAGNDDDRETAEPGSHPAAREEVAAQSDAPAPDEVAGQRGAPGRGRTSFKPILVLAAAAPRLVERGADGGMEPPGEQPGRQEFDAVGWQAPGLGCPPAALAAEGEALNLEMIPWRLHGARKVSPVLREIPEEAWERHGDEPIYRSADLPPDIGRGAAGALLRPRQTPDRSGERFCRPATPVWAKIAEGKAPESERAAEMLAPMIPLCLPHDLHASRDEMAPFDAGDDDAPGWSEGDLSGFEFGPSLDDEDEPERSTLGKASGERSSRNGAVPHQTAGPMDLSFDVENAEEEADVLDSASGA